MSNDITAERLRELLHYDPETGWVVNAVGRGGPTKAGTRAGSIGPKGYRRVMVNGKAYQEHRLAWLYVYGVMPTKFIDHIDGDPTNNRLSNLREATNAQNLANTGKHCTNTSGHKGVSWDTRAKKWRAQIKFNNTKIYLGLFTNKEDAAAAYQAAALKHFGEFARS